MSRLIAILTLFAFNYLVSYAYGTTARPTYTVQQPITAEVDMDPQAETSGGYDKTLRKGADNLWKQVERDLTKREAAEVLAKVYGITAENADAYRRWFK